MMVASHEDAAEGGCCARAAVKLVWAGRQRLMVAAKAGGKLEPMDLWWSWLKMQQGGLWW